MNEKYLIESDGQTYGPADVDQLIQWVAEGRVVATTTLINAATNERKLAGDHAELRSWFAPRSEDRTTNGATSYPAPPPTGRAGDSGVGGYPGVGGGYQQQQRQPPVPLGYGVPSYGVPSYADTNNDSGTGAMARLPAELQGVNFGAFAIPIWWAIFNRSYLGLLAFIPCLNVIIPFVMLFKGNEWAWQNRRFESIEHFRQVQQSWQRWGILIFVLNVIFTIVAFLGRNNGNP